MDVVEAAVPVLAPTRVLIISVCVSLAVMGKSVAAMAAEAAVEAVPAITFA